MPDQFITYVHQGQAYFDSGQYVQAIGAFDQAIALKPDLAVAYSRRGEAYYRLGEIGKAIQDFEQYLELDPSAATDREEVTQIHQPYIRKSLEFDPDTTDREKIAYRIRSSKGKFEDIPPYIPKRWLDKRVNMFWWRIRDTLLNWLSNVRTWAGKEEEGEVTWSGKKEWEEFLARLQPGDELWYYSSPPETWENMIGESGIALVRNGEIIDSYEDRF